MRPQQDNKQAPESLEAFEKMVVDNNELYQMLLKQVPEDKRQDIQVAFKQYIAQFYQNIYSPLSKML